jgi:hypothetical protein
MKFSNDRLQREEGGKIILIPFLQTEPRLGKYFVPLLDISIIQRK